MFRVPEPLQKTNHAKELYNNFTLKPYLFAGDVISSSSKPKERGQFVAQVRSHSLGTFQVTYALLLRIYAWSMMYWSYCLYAFEVCFVTGSQEPSAQGLRSS